ncbi:MAG: PD-(D/E)XK nuclease family protein [Vampirovibrionales bacterium]|nr:PD-(D/E)XK nuclease family protein [Vampirovibrionales bacterium]
MRFSGESGQLGLALTSVSAASSFSDEALGSPDWPGLLQGDYQSGKTSRMLQWAKEACARGDRVIFLVRTASEKNRLLKLWAEEAPNFPIAVPIQIDTVEHFLEIQARQILGENGPRLLPRIAAQTVFSRLLQDVLGDEEHPHYFAARQSGFQRRLLECLLQEMALSPECASLASELPPDFEWVLQLGERFGQWLKESGYISRPALEQTLRQAIQAKDKNQHIDGYPVYSSILLPPETNADTEERATLILMDDADGYLDKREAERHLTIFNVWRQQQPDKRQLILSGVLLEPLPGFAQALPEAKLFKLPASVSMPESHSDRAVFSALIDWCDSAGKAPLTLSAISDKGEELVNDKFSLLGRLSGDLFSDAQQEADALACWIKHHVQSAKTTVWDDERQSLRPCRFSDFLLLNHQPHFTRLLVEALLLQEVPVHPESIPLDLSAVQTVFYDVLQILSAFERLETINGEPIETLLKKARPPFKAQEELWENAAHSLERLLQFIQAEVPNNSAYANGDSDYETVDETEPPAWQLLFLIYHQKQLGGQYRLSSLGSQKAFKRLQTLLTFHQVQVTEPGDFSVRFKQLINEDILPSATEDSDLAALSKTLQKSLLQKNLDDAFWLPLKELSQTLIDLRPTELFDRFFDLWQAPSEYREMSANALQDAVRIRAIVNTRGKHVSFVGVPFLSEAALLFQGADKSLSELLQGMGDSSAKEADSPESWRQLAFAIGRAKDCLWLSGHQKYEQEMAWPHPALMQLWQYCLRQSSEMRTLEEAAAKRLSGGEPNGLSNGAYEASGAWAHLKRAETDCVIKTLDSSSPQPEAKALPLSPSALNTFILCPRQYFYRHLLRLPEVRQGAASAGLLVHRIMEVFNRNVSAGTLDHTGETLQLLAERFFNFEAHGAQLKEWGFSDGDFNWLRTSNEFYREDLKQLVKLSFEDLSHKGYFKRLENLKAIEPEKPIKGLSLPGLEGVVFSGTVDVVVEFSDGTFEIIDYKFYSQSRFDKSPEKTLENWQKVLSPMLIDQDSGFIQLGNKNTDPRDYQLPLYYLALSQDPKYRNKIRRAVLQLIRPGFGNDNEKGATPLALEAYDIEEALESHITADLNCHVVAAIRQARHFLPNSNACLYCHFTDICDASEKSEPDNHRASPLGS